MGALHKDPEGIWTRKRVKTLPMNCVHFPNLYVYLVYIVFFFLITIDLDIRK